ncbi:hypothetical protein AXF42_Ash017001 [Apostasia shenzhenica]|uniref:Lipocalin/cytosolic fatty-acid binding domain-containing protein n=1 Tax=Apostasia shenzhenica TaxID=1088818 RepID=A0A2I0B7D2_9ASPA|nr:hypothetical protein AXF42_Ash017001 [Apostasia shenzhenica]
MVAWSSRSVINRSKLHSKREKLFQKILEGMAMLQAWPLCIQTSYNSPSQIAAYELSAQRNICQLANAIAGTSPINSSQIEERRSEMMTMMMRGMTAKNFDPIRYSGRWFEVASLKRGFAGQGQEDCHCTQGIYTFDSEAPSIQVSTFCVHGSPDGFITGIRGEVQCLAEQDMQKAETVLERQEMIREKCYLRFPTLPFIPKEPYDVIATDYDNFAIVSGAKDRSFVQFTVTRIERNINLENLHGMMLNLSNVYFRSLDAIYSADLTFSLISCNSLDPLQQIYSRRPNPGPDFIQKYKSYLAGLGYDPSKIRDTPQDCQAMSSAQLALMMAQTGTKKALTNEFPDLELKAPVEFNPFTSIFDTLKKLLELYFK